MPGRYNIAFLKYFVFESYEDWRGSVLEDAVLNSAVDLRRREIYPSCSDYVIAAPLP